MCGIAGWLDHTADLKEKMDELQKMSECLKRRGPDEHGEYIRRHAALLHRRLSVIDPENGQQPMSTLYEGEKYTIVYNGELYNTAELREELKAAGFGFGTRSDTEVLLKAYCYYKEACAEKLNGIFAFAVYEENAGRLFLCRDRVGVKPLFYHTYPDGIVFGSEIKAIFHSGMIAPRVDEEGLYELFFLGPARTPGNGIFKGISELLPGEYAVYENGKLQRRRYYRLTAHPHEDDEAQTIERIRYLLTDAIERQLVSDVPMCFFLSGGLDSGIICQTASNYYNRQSDLLPTSTRPLGERYAIHTYSVEYADNRRYFTKTRFQPNADFEYIDKMVQSTESHHHEIILDNKDVLEALYPSVKARDLPGYVDIDSSLLLFCREIKKDFTVALSGECADELFGGYPWYHDHDILFEDCFPWSREQDIRRYILKDGVLPKGESYVRERYLDTIRAVDSLPRDSKIDKRMREMFALNYYWFMQCLLERKDRCSMYSGLEVRVPFCDARLIDYAYNMPWQLKAYGGREKGIIRKAFEDILPREIVYRKKSPYPKTHNPIYHQLCAEKVNRILSDPTRRINELIDADHVREIMEHPEKITSPWYGQLMKAPQILAYLIEVDYWLEEYHVRIEV
ncbi:asparagine synthase (glutamine-hydrolyzing) [Ruminococcus sp.]|uniref:asparagine synthase (glutamine-hydrolyzing) n=1 Tax=Ruminococcus sp. TaxID=41978 RepID=UPI002E801C1B|nr:asparagine synthase (glutamine-hydrolyzing) [Ruminococcus sp.]MEE3491484.1 asparagine synthase (glutamine-hydrolyzing) [Ruminococcus sp.]